MSNKAARFSYKSDDLPGPADYDPKIRTKKCPRLDPTPIPDKGKLFCCRVPYTVGVSGPSIPTRIDENGYNLQKNGNLVKMPPDEHDTTLGPAFYPVETRLSYDRYKGCCWSARTGKRSTVQKSNTPAPNAYTLKPDCCPREEADEEFRQMARLLTYLPRFLERQEDRARREDAPGPGYYNLENTGVKIKKPRGVNPKPFISGSIRFKECVSDTPSPALYTVPELKKIPVSKINVPFGIESDRFLGKKIDSTPGPACYSVKGDIQKKIEKKRNPYSTVVVPFDVLAERQFANISKDSVFKPGPDEYNLDRERKQKPVDAFVFKSKTCRFPGIPASSNANAATYNISGTYRKIHGSVSHNVANVSFNATHPKCIQTFDNNPAPGQYHKREYMGNRGYYFNTTPRFESTETAIPGPGAYKIDPAVSDSMHKASGTHNLRLKENVLHTKLKLPPSATYHKWIKEMKKKKKLRWFSQPTEYYRHCIFLL